MGDMTYLGDICDFIDNFYENFQVENSDPTKKAFTINLIMGTSNLTKSYLQEQVIKDILSNVEAPPSVFPTLDDIILLGHPVDNIGWQRLVLWQVFLTSEDIHWRENGSGQRAYHPINGETTSTIYQYYTSLTRFKNVIFPNWGEILAVWEPQDALKFDYVG